ncbi:MAG: sulfite exporter TauE/SafE family protein [Dehalococcoidia bacterium]
MLIIAALLSLFIGLSLGLLGGGGSILTLPILVYVLDVEPKTAIAMSLFVVGTTSATGVVAHARAGRVRFRAGLVFGAAGMAGAFAGGKVAHFLPPTLLLVGFGAVMLTAAVAMMRPRRESGVGREPAISKAIGIGLGVGVVAGLVGAGGGFLIVPALALFGGLAMPEAIGTSLLVIALQSFAGFAGHAGHVHLDWTLTTVVTGAAIAGGLGGARLARHLSPASLRRGFAWLVLAMGVFLLGKQIPAPALRAIAEHAGVYLSLAVAAAGLIALGVFFLRLRPASSPKEGPAR